VLIPRRIWKEVALIRVWLEDTNENRTCERWDMTGRLSEVHVNQSSGQSAKMKDWHPPPRQEVDLSREKTDLPSDILWRYNSHSIIHWWKLQICKYLPWSLIVNTRSVLVLKALGQVAIQRVKDSNEWRETSIL
jgi:hypothetical protein